jgi:C2 domain
MTELELQLNHLDVGVNDEWGFGQILPLILTIAPLLSLWEAILTKRARKPLSSSSSTHVRFTIQSATNLTRRHRLSSDEALLNQGWTEEEIVALKAPSPFAVLTIDEKDVYTTFDLRDAMNPGWKETFDVEISETSTIVVRIFDLKCMGTECLGADGHGLIGYTTILPSAMLWEMGKDDSNSTGTAPREGARVQIKSFPLIRDGKIIPGTTFEASISTDTSGPIPLAIPPQYIGLERTTEERKVAMFHWRGRRRGYKETTLTETYNL